MRFLANIYFANTNVSNLTANSSLSSFTTPWRQNMIEGKYVKQQKATLSHARSRNNCFTSTDLARSFHSFIFTERSHVGKVGQRKTNLIKRESSTRANHRFVLIFLWINFGNLTLSHDKNELIKQKARTKSLNEGHVFCVHIRERRRKLSWKLHKLPSNWKCTSHKWQHIVSVSF